MTITVDTQDLKNLTAKADGIFLDAKAEETLVDLLALAEQVEMAVKEAKVTLEATALKLDPNFQSIQGDKIKVGYRYFGARWTVDESNLKLLPEAFYTKKTTYSVNTEEVDKQLKTGKLPMGLKENERAKTITISIKK